MNGPADVDPLRTALRWRLVLGRHAEQPLPLEGDRGEGAPSDAAAQDRALGFLYDREHEARGHRRAGQGDGDGVFVPEWIRGVRRLFPKEAVEVIERDALSRYGLTELVTDPEILRTTPPSLELVAAILTLKDQLAPAVKVEARRVIRAVIDALTGKLRRECEPAFTGAPDPLRARPVRTFRNADWHRTIRRNLKNWDPAEDRLVADRISFRHRQRGRAAWRIVIAVDQSGSMVDSLIHAAVLTAILAGLPSVTVHLVLWDHRVVDLSGRVHDPLEVLLASQLGGGTLLYPALRYCADLITVPERTVLAVVSDWHLFDEVGPSLELARELAASGVQCLGLCALDPSGRGAYDLRFARALADAQWWVGAVTPRQLAEQIGSRLA